MTPNKEIAPRFPDIHPVARGGITDIECHHFQHAGRGEAQARRQREQDQRLPLFAMQKGFLPERTAETDEALWVLCDLRARPVFGSLELTLRRGTGADLLTRTCKGKQQIRGGFPASPVICYYLLAEVAGCGM